MNEGVKILLARMRSNPEEFKTQMKEGVWSDIIGGVREYAVTGEARNLWFLEESEKQALVDALHEVHRDNFTHEIMDRMFNWESQHRDSNPLTTSFARYTQSYHDYYDPLGGVCHESKDMCP